MSISSIRTFLSLVSQPNIITLTLPFLALITLLYALYRASWISKQDDGEGKMKEIADYIENGASAFLKAEYKAVAGFVVVASIILAYLGYKDPHNHPLIAVAFIIGAVFSGIAGLIGMKVATKTNVRTAQAARSSLAKAFSLSFSGGMVMGLGVTGLAMLGLSGLFFVFYMYFHPTAIFGHSGDYMRKILEVLTGFSLGAESVALFARVAGGIYTKAADVGADIVGKIEAGIPEDDPRNPATIADNVGDNVGDVAGMGADLFGSYVATVLAAMVLGAEATETGLGLVIFPLVLGTVGIILSWIASLFVKIKNEKSDVQAALNRGNWIAILLTAFASYGLIQLLLPSTFSMRGEVYTARFVFYAVLTGLGVGTLISMITEYFTSMGKKPVFSIVKQSRTGHATNIIAGLSVGMISTVFPMILFAGGIYASFFFAGFYGVAIAAAGMMATTAMQLAIDGFGPIADNAGGIAEMSGLPEEVRQRTDILDTVGNTTAATGKGFAIASAALTSLALFAAFVRIADIQTIDIYKADVLAGLFIGAMVPFCFSALAISAVGKAAMAMVEEVRRQFREIKGIMEGKAEPEYGKCVDISTQAAIREMVLPGALAILTPIVVGFAFGAEVLGGMLAGVTVSGVLMAIFQSNAGGAWDNAKKSFEKGVDVDGEILYKGSEAHKASVTGDTVGDPFKDTSGPAMNILIKLTSIVALVIAPHLGSHSKASNRKEVTTKTQTTTHDASQSIHQKLISQCPVGDNVHYHVYPFLIKTLGESYNDDREAALQKAKREESMGAADEKPFTANLTESPTAHILDSFCVHRDCISIGLYLANGEALALSSKGGVIDSIILEDSYWTDLKKGVKKAICIPVPNQYTFDGKEAYAIVIRPIHNEKTS